MGQSPPEGSQHRQIHQGLLEGKRLQIRMSEPSTPKGKPPKKSTIGKRNLLVVTSQRPSKLRTAAEASLQDSRSRATRCYRRLRLCTWRSRHC